MPEQDDLQIAFHALQQGDITRPQLLDALYGMAEDRAAGLPGRALGAILVQKRYLPHQRLREIITANAMPGIIPEEATRGDAIKLGELLAMCGVVTYAQVMEALLQQEIGREQGQPRMRLGEYLVSMGYTTPQAIQRVLAYQRKAVYGCKKCRARFNIVNAQPNQLYQCARCLGQIVPETDDVRVDESSVVEPMEETFSTPPAEPSSEDAAGFPMERVEEDRTIMRHLRGHKLVSDKALRDAERWQLEIAQFGLHAPILDILKRLKAIEEDAATLKPEKVPAFGDLKRAINGYEVIGRVTSGPTASIFTAQPLHTPGPVGIKILHPDLSRDESQVARFKQDASMLIRFDHPGLAKGYQYGSVQLPDGLSLHYLTTEYMRGTALDHLLGVKGRLSPSRSVTLALSIAHALRYMEREGFVIQDVRPENVLIDERHRARLIGVGSAVGVGTSGLPSPLVAESVLSVGKLLRAMLTGVYTEENRPGLDLGSVCLSVTVLEVLGRMMEPDPARRFQRFGDVVMALQAAAEPAVG